VDFRAISAKNGYRWFIQSISSKSRILGLVNILFLLKSSSEGEALNNIINLGY
jgi:hypothetical protein